MSMGTRTIAVSDDVFNLLKALKRPEESFTDLLKRLAGKPSLLQLVRVLSKDQAADLRKTVAEGRSRSRARRARAVR